MVKTFCIGFDLERIDPGRITVLPFQDTNTLAIPIDGISPISTITDICYISTGRSFISLRNSQIKIPQEEVACALLLLDTTTCAILTNSNKLYR